MQLFPIVLAQRTKLLVPALLFVLALAVVAQRQPVAPHYDVPTLVQLNRNSGYIFVGTVKSVTRVEPTSPGGVGTVLITFHVENAVRGVHDGQTLVIREWAGRWESGEHYRVGERTMLFLFPPGKLGLTSPVGGELGKFRIDSYGHVLLNREQVAAVSANPVLAAPWQGRSRMTWRELSNGIRLASQEWQSRGITGMGAIWLLKTEIGPVWVSLKFSISSWSLSVPAWLCR
jgi:hypothetical protein